MDLLRNNLSLVRRLRPKHLRRPSDKLSSLNGIARLKENRFDNEFNHLPLGYEVNIVRCWMMESEIA